MLLCYIHVGDVYVLFVSAWICLDVFWMKFIGSAIEECIYAFVSRVTGVTHMKP